MRDDKANVFAANAGGLQRFCHGARHGPAKAAAKPIQPGGQTIEVAQAAGEVQRCAAEALLLSPLRVEQAASGGKRDKRWRDKDQRRTVVQIAASFTLQIADDAYAH